MVILALLVIAAFALEWKRRRDPVPSTMWNVLRLLVWVGVVGSFAMTVFWAWSFSQLGNDIDRSDFETEAKAVEFVQGHLPIPLPQGVAVPELTFQSFTDWYLEATVVFPSVGERTDFLEALRQHPDAKGCDEPLPPGGATYSLPKVQACGRVNLGGAPAALVIECNTF